MVKTNGEWRVTVASTDKIQYLVDYGIGINGEDVVVKHLDKRQVNCFIF